MWVHLPKLASSLATEALRLVSDSPAYQSRPCATSKTTPTAKNLSLKESKTGGWMMRHYGTMSEPLTGDPGVDTWILLLRDSRASHTASLDNAAARLTNVISGQTPLESFGKWDQDTCCWRTFQASLNLQDQAGGQLNPGFVEWLQGVPKLWTSLEPLDPVAYHRWQQGDHWGDGEWPGVPRVASGVAHRVNRLRALGNGIVPAVVAEFLHRAADN